MKSKDVPTRDLDPRTPHPAEEGKDLMAEVQLERDRRGERAHRLLGRRGRRQATNLRADPRASCAPTTAASCASRADAARPDRQLRRAADRARRGRAACARASRSSPCPAAPSRRRRASSCSTRSTAWCSSSTRAADRIDENVARSRSCAPPLAAYGRALEDVPLVVQYNKRDHSDPYALEELHRKLDVKGAAVFEAVAERRHRRAPDAHDDLEARRQAAA